MDSFPTLFHPEAERTVNSTVVTRSVLPKLGSQFSDILCAFADDVPSGIWTCSATMLASIGTVF